VDRQLRGRAGRQGDPGSSQFYVSLEDELMRLFGSERIANLMDRMGHEEGEVIQHSMITKSIERAQKKVEENNFGIRKRLLEYDDVMNRQREVIYTRRRHALFGERLANDLQNSFYDLCEELIGAGKENNDHESFKLDVIRCFAMDTPITAEELQKQDAAQLTERLYAQVSETYERKMNALSAQTLPVLQSIFQDKGESIRFVAIPFSDGIRGLNVVVNLAEEVETECRNIRVQFEKNITLALIDEAWKNHLRRMDDLKSEVQTASYEQKDPLVIYKIESFNLFKELISTVNRDVASYLFKGQVPAINNPTLNSGPVKAMREPARPAPTPRLKESRDEIGAATASGGSSGAETPAQEVRKTEPVRVGDKIGRNDPCPCGSGKKYKKCHGAHLDD
jgi:preprotein translocase subunit SecA